MTAKDIAQIEDQLTNIFNRVGKLDTSLAVILEKFDHVLTRTQMEIEVTKQIKLAQAECPNNGKAKPNNNTTDWIKIIKIVGIITIPIISAITGHEIGVN